MPGLGTRRRGARPGVLVLAGVAALWRAARGPSGAGCPSQGEAFGAARNPRSHDDACVYKVLGVPRSASQDEIKRAFRTLALKHHPDVSSEAGAAERFLE